MTERSVSNVMKECSQAYKVSISVIDSWKLLVSIDSEVTPIVRVPFERAHHFFGSLYYTQSVSMTRMSCAWVDLMRHAELPNSTKSLKEWSVEEQSLPRVEINAPPYWIIDGLGKESRAIDSVKPDQ